MVYELAAILVTATGASDHIWSSSSSSSPSSSLSLLLCTQGYSGGGTGGSSSRHALKDCSFCRDPGLRSRVAQASGSCRRVCRCSMPWSWLKCHTPCSSAEKWVRPREAECRLANGENGPAALLKAKPSLTGNQAGRDSFSSLVRLPWSLLPTVAVGQFLPGPVSFEPGPS